MRVYIYRYSFLLLVMLLLGCSSPDGRDSSGLYTDSGEPSGERVSISKEQEALQRRLLSSLSSDGDSDGRISGSDDKVQDEDILFRERGYETIALLAPLTGADASMGKSLSQAVALALFNEGDIGLNIVFVDTSMGISAAVSRVRSVGAIAVIGPVWAKEVLGGRKELLSLGIPVLSFSNSAAIASDYIYPMGFSPEGQVSSLLDRAYSDGSRSVSLMAPSNAYGSRVADLLENSLSGDERMSFDKVVFYDSGATDFSSYVSVLGGRRFRSDVIVLASVRAHNLRTIVSQLDSVDLVYPDVRIMGLQLWDEFGDLTTEPSLESAVWVSSRGVSWVDFVSMYRRAYGGVPHGLASLAYDSMVALIELHGRGRVGGREWLEDDFAVSFDGINGVFRLGSGGRVERDYYVRVIEGGRVRLER